MKTQLVISCLLILVSSCINPVENLEEGTYYFYLSESEKYHSKYALSKFNDTVFLLNKFQKSRQWEKGVQGYPGYEKGTNYYSSEVEYQLPVQSGNNLLLKNVYIVDYEDQYPFKKVIRQWTDKYYYKINDGQIQVLNERGKLEALFSPFIIEESAGITE